MAFYIKLQTLRTSKVGNNLSGHDDLAHYLVEHLGHLMTLILISTLAS